MNRVIVYLLAICLLGQSLGAAWVFAGFYSNRDYIVQNECTYRFEVVNTCRGQCILVKQLKNVQDQEQERPDFKIKDLVLLALPEEKWMLTPAATEKEAPAHLPAARNNFYQSLYISSIDRPPIV